MVSDEAVEVLFKVRADAADAMNLILTDHLGERQAKFGSGMTPASVTNIFPPPERCFTPHL